MQEYDLSSTEGVTLMCLAEALLRIPDAATQDLFIEDKLGGADWSEHLGASEHFFVNASTFGLMLAGRAVTVSEGAPQAVDRVVKKLGAPAVRVAVRRAMRILGRQFVFGETISAALERATEQRRDGARYDYSFDMLGEAAWTGPDAEWYFERYRDAVELLGADAAAGARSPQISVKLSALHPRFEYTQWDRVHGELYERLLMLCRLAAARGVGICIDAEESDRLELTLSLFERLLREAALAGWDGLGVAVQAYQKRALAVVDWLLALCGSRQRPFHVRLVKGAYWDAEIKLTQERGLTDFPVFTRKVNTDVSYLACASRLLEAPAELKPCFATHNAYTVAALLELGGPGRDLEFQRLHGMGQALYDHVLGDSALQERRRLQCRVYAPVGGQADLLAYLVRRLLENGANTSFVNRIADDALDIDDVVQDPVAVARAQGWSGHPAIRRPGALFEPERRNSRGRDLNDGGELALLAEGMEEAARRIWRAGSGRARGKEPALSVRDPTVPTREVGVCFPALPEQARDALDAAAVGAAAWDRTPVSSRAACLRRASEAMEADAAALIWLLCREAGRTLQDAHLEVREAVDFLRYYAAQAERLQGSAMALPGPTGESNRLRYRGRGPFLCISPWNFPLAIFTGQVAAALATGNSVLAKPAEQTPLIAAAAVQMLHEAGVPGEVLRLLPGAGAELAGALLQDPRLAGVAFTAGLRTLPASNASIVATLEPVIALGLGGLFLGEVIELPQMLGAGLIVTAVIVLRTSRADRPASPGQAPRDAAARLHCPSPVGDCR